MKNFYAVAFVFCSLFSFGSHSIGGSISWQNVGPSQFVFKLVIVQKCLGPTAYPINIRDLETPFGVVQLTLKDSEGYTPTCELAPGMWCYSFNSIWALSTMVFYSDTITVNSTPPPSGWKFYYREYSRPSNTVNMQVASNIETDIYSWMYPETVTHNLSSPEFMDTYDESITPYNHTLTNQAYSNQSGDSLYYQLVQPKTGTGAYTFNSGYNYLKPFPTQANNPANGLMVFNPHTGEISTDVQAATDGYYGYTMMVEQWRKIDDGQMLRPVKVSAVRKDNLIPVMTSNLFANAAPTAFIDTSVYQNVYQGTTTAYGVKAQVGDTVRLRIQASDADLDSNLVLQTTTFDAKGAALDSSWGGWELYSSIPKLTPAPGQSSFVSQGTNSIDFEWYIAPDLVDSVSNSFHTFKFNFTDNNCEWKGRTSISLVVGVAASVDTASGVGAGEFYKSSITVYPNPAHESFTVKGLTGKSVVQLLDIQGKLVETHSTTEPKLEIERGSLPSGIYFVKISDSNTTTLEKVLFE